ncbi:MAG: general secretion pathway protein GspF [Gammaproteobacteria bacterium]|nr:general secretion pathway protein GspF [Gammaproteobacteria bacterium]
MALQRARNAKEYAEWVEQARFEVGDLRECLLYDMEEIGETGRFPVFLEVLEQGIEEVYQAMRQGRYAFGREDLLFMEVVEAHADQIPFAILLKQINETHRRGLDVKEDQ